VTPKPAKPGSSSLGPPASRRQLTPSSSAPPSPSPLSPPTTPWHSRGYLPHFDHPNLLQSLTFRLHDAVPQPLIDSWRAELNRNKTLTPQSREAQLRKLLDTYEDAGHGACWLRDPRIAALVENALLHFDTQRYCLIAWCLMPNHVHALIETAEAWPLGAIIHSWKSFTSHGANQILRRSGDFWFREYFDRFIRDEQHFVNAVTYIERNPVKAGLAGSPEEWRWSSAWRRREERKLNYG
jgi:REP element-mobilizing transposase RayT